MVFKLLFLSAAVFLALDPSAFNWEILGESRDYTLALVIAFLLQPAVVGQFD